jgi:hypothetical protein
MPVRKHKDPRNIPYVRVQREQILMLRVLSDEE